MWNAHTMAPARPALAEAPLVTTTVAALIRSLRTTGRRLGRNRGPRGVGVSTYDLTVSLVAARLEDDDAIHLIIADTQDPALGMLVELPAPAAYDKSADLTLQARFQSGRDALVTAIGQPPFEGFALLYGRARLTLVPLSRREGALTAGAERKPSYRVLDFVALDGAEPAREIPTFLDSRFGGFHRLDGLAAA